MISGSKIKLLTIGRLAQEVGINLETVRFYERKGLLPKPPRSASGYRLFPADTARRLQFIKRAQELGFSLSEIRELLTLRLSPRSSKIESLDCMRHSLLKLVRSCGGCAPLSECPILESLDREGLRQMVLPLVLADSIVGTVIKLCFHVLFKFFASDMQAAPSALKVRCA